jgi:hypothetical protein
MRRGIRNRDVQKYALERRRSKTGEDKTTPTTRATGTS